MGNTYTDVHRVFSGSYSYTIDLLLYLFTYLPLYYSIDYVNLLRTTYTNFIFYNLSVIQYLVI